jgi:hydroxymethylglutaryl-CoA reductase
MEAAGLSADEADALCGLNTLTPDGADHMVENAAGVFPLPLALPRTL